MLDGWTNILPFLHPPPRIFAVFPSPPKFTAYGEVKEMQLVLKQPSPHWIKFGLADLKCFAGMEETDAVRLASPSVLCGLVHCLILSAF